MIGAAPQCSENFTHRINLKGLKVVGKACHVHTLGTQAIWADAGPALGKNGAQGRIESNRDMTNTASV